MSLRRIAIGLTPSFIVDAARRRQAEEFAAIERRRQQAIEAEKRAASWEDACARAGSYAEDYVNRFRVARAAGYIPNGSFFRENLLAIVAHHCGKPDMEITDLGGATGELGADLLHYYPQARFTVVETQPLVALIAKETIRPRVTFTSRLPAACDIFYSSGTLQYLADPMALLVQGLESARSAAILRRNNFSDVEKFDIQKSRLHHNGTGPVPEGFPDQEISYPRRTLKEADVIAAARARGFELVAGLPGWDGAGEGNYDKQLLFWRTQARN
jgi:putative methyltransferase (TIGR04325 family)